MNNLLVDKEAIRIKYKKDFGTEIPYNNYNFNSQIFTTSKRDYINWLEAIVSECLRKGF